MLQKDPTITSSKHAIRLDIQGLRALAVLLVVAQHVFAAPSGGYIGVDVFFVVSGYVITGQLLRSFETSGTISLVRFYHRRVRRILPASVVVLAATVVAGGLLLSIPRAGQLRTDALWTALLSANWRFALIGTDYLHATDAPSPLQHYWSLAVEEQYYLVWPLLVLAAAMVWRARARRAVAVTAAVLVVVTFAISCWQSNAAPTYAYFATESRAWELGIGALLAAGAPLVARIPAGSRNPLAWTGLTVIVFAAFRLDANSVFPGPWALLPVLGTAAIIAAGEGHVTQLYPLQNRLATTVGDLSFSLYLWHFPVMVFVGVLHPQHGHAYLFWTLTITALLALASFHLIETPLRRSGFKAITGLIRRPTTGRPRRIALAAVSGGLFVALTMTFVTRAPMHASATPLEELHLEAPTAAAEVQRASAVEAGLQATEWPITADETVALSTQLAPEWIRDGCLGDDINHRGDPLENALRCVYGDKHAPRTLALLGDSTAISYLPALISAAHGAWRIEVYTLQQCPAVDVDTKLGNGAPYPHCAAFHDEVFDHLKSERPAQVVLTSSPDSSYRLASGAVGTDASAEWTAGTARTLSELSKISGRVSLLDPPPSIGQVQDCYTPLSTPSACISGVESGYLLQAMAQKAAVTSLPSPSNVRYPQTIGWFCSPSGLCPAIVGGRPQTVDGRHLAEPQAQLLAPVVRAALHL